MNCCPLLLHPTRHPHAALALVQLPGLQVISRAGVSQSGGRSHHAMAWCGQGSWGNGLCVLEYPCFPGFGIFGTQYTFNVVAQCCTQPSQPSYLQTRCQSSSMMLVRCSLTGLQGMITADCCWLLLSQISNFWGCSISPAKRNIFLGVARGAKKRSSPSHSLINLITDRIWILELRTRLHNSSAIFWYFVYVSKSTKFLLCFY